MKRWWSRWSELVAEEELPDAMAAFRVMVGLVVFGTALTPLLTGVDLLFVADEHGGLAPNGRGPALWLWLGGSTPGAIRALFVSMLLGSVAVITGIGGRWASLVLGQLCLVYFSLHPGTGGGHDRLITNALWLLFLSGAHTSWALPVRWRTGAWRSMGKILAWPRRAAVFQLILMYTLTGFQKQGDAWTVEGDFRAVYDTMLLPSWSRWDLVGVADVFWLTQVSTIVAWWWEALWFVLLFWYALLRPSWRGTRSGRLARRFDLRVPFVVLGLITHGILWLTSNLGPFTPVTFAFYLCMWTELDTRRVLAGRGSPVQ